MKPKYGAPKKDNPRAFKVSVMLTAEEMALIDIHRGALTRSSFGRACMLSFIPQKVSAKHNEE